MPDKNRIRKYNIRAPVKAVRPLLWQAPCLTPFLFYICLYLRQSTATLSIARPSVYL